MKNHIHILLAVIILGFGVASSHAGTDTDKDLSKKLSDFLTKYEKIRPGMTREALTNDFRVYTGAVLNNGLFMQHQTFSYSGCSLIKFDIEFSTSGVTKEKPTDVISKISKPYLEWDAKD